MSLSWGYERFKDIFHEEVHHLRLILLACFQQLRLDHNPLSSVKDDELYLCRRVCANVSSLLHIFVDVIAEYSF